MSTSGDSARRDPDLRRQGESRAVPVTGQHDRDRDGVDDRREAAERTRDGANDRRAGDGPADRRDVVARQRETFGGIKIGAAFFGWLTAVGVVTLLTAVLAATGAALGLGIEDAEDAAGDVGIAPEAIGWIGIVALLVILFVAYYCGGYVAGRMARFNGLKQGLAVWLWALVIAIVVALLGLLFGSRFDVFADLNVFPRIPVSEGELTVAGIITAIVVVLASLGGALLGGKAGTHYHRKVDRAGFEG